MQGRDERHAGELFSSSRRRPPRSSARRGPRQERDGQKDSRVGKDVGFSGGGGHGGLRRSLAILPRSSWCWTPFCPCGSRLLWSGSWWRLWANS